MVFKRRENTAKKIAVGSVIAGAAGYLAGILTAPKRAKPAIKPSDFVHLHNHTQYSLLDGLTKVPSLIERVKYLGMDAVAITDHGTMSGAVEFYKTGKAGGLKPIIGMEAYVSPRGHT